MTLFILIVGGAIVLSVAGIFWSSGGMVGHAVRARVEPEEKWYHYHMAKSDEHNSSALGWIAISLCLLAFFVLVLQIGG